jgi:AcrR family transcriptional regulator
MPRYSDKRDRLIESADRLILQQGFRETTLADIADDSGVPLGNLYYYFKSKDAIGRAVVDSRIQRMQELLARCSTKPEPKARLLEFLDHPLTIRDQLAASGCPLGTLSYELSRGNAGLSDASRTLVEVVLDWSQAQFGAIDSSDAKGMALQFVTSLQGMSLVANALGDATVIDRTVADLRAWIGAL